MVIDMQMQRKWKQNTVPLYQQPKWNHRSEFSGKFGKTERSGENWRIYDSANLFIWHMTRDSLYATGRRQKYIKTGE